MQFWLSAYEKICVTLSHARMWKQWDSFSKALTSNSYLGNYWGMLSQKVNMCSMNCILSFFVIKTSMRLYINWLWKISPMWEQFTAVTARPPYIYTHFDVHISKHYSWLQLPACHLHLYKAVGRDSREVDPRYLPQYLLPSWQALWGALT